MSEEEKIDQEPESNEIPEMKTEPVSTDQSPVQNKENMEVYHHPDLHHKKKKWHEYFLEFLMIFLAVTLGFFAENLREFISDKGHVRQLSAQLVHDLKTDTSVLEYNIEQDLLLIKKTDSLFFLLQEPLSKLDSKKLQDFILACYNIHLFQASSGAMLAVKNELHLKQFANSDITLFISNYESDEALLKKVEEFQMANLKEYIQDFMTAHFTSANAYSALSEGSIKNGDLRNISQNDLTQLSINVTFVKNYNATLAGKSKQLKDRATEFIQYVQKEFE
jgi:hypothetical protein